MKKAIVILLVAILSVSAIFAVNFGLESDINYYHNGTKPNVYWTLKPYVEAGGFTFKANVDYRNDGFKSLKEFDKSSVLAYPNSILQYVDTLDYQGENLYVGASRDLKVTLDHLVFKDIDLVAFWNDAMGIEKYGENVSFPYRGLPFLVAYDNDSFALSAFISDLRLPLEQENATSPIVASEIGFVSGELKATEKLPVGFEFSAVIAGSLKATTAKVEPKKFSVLPQLKVYYNLKNWRFSAAYAASLQKDFASSSKVDFSTLYKSSVSELAAEYAGDKLAARVAVFANLNESPSDCGYQYGIPFSDDAFTNMGIDGSVGYSDGKFAVSFAANVPLDVFDKTGVGRFVPVVQLNGEKALPVTKDTYKLEASYTEEWFNVFASVDAKDVFGYVLLKNKTADTKSYYKDNIPSPLNLVGATVGAKLTSRLVEFGAMVSVDDMADAIKDKQFPVSVSLKIKADSIASR